LISLAISWFDITWHNEHHTLVCTFMHMLSNAAVNNTQYLSHPTEKMGPAIFHLIPVHFKAKLEFAIAFFILYDTLCW
jgi:hypothetical protein